VAAVETPTTPSPDDPVLSPIGRWLAWKPPEWDEDTRRQVLDELFYEGPEWRPFVARFATLIVLSTTIAGFGLIADSAAVVIGAMLVAPLMTPILAVAGATVFGQVERLAVSASVLVAGTVGAVATGWLVGAIAPGAVTLDDLTGELLARTTPSLLDLAVAVAAGLARGYVLTHPRAGSSLPGVAIAVALVPPLATVGITWQLGATSQARGSLLLYVTNMVAIILSAMVVMLASGFVPPHVRETSRGRVRMGLVVSVLAVVGVAVPLTLHTLDVLEEQRFTRDVLDAIATWDPSARVVTIDADPDGARATVDLVVASSQAPRPAWRLAELLAPTLGTPVDVAVQYRQDLQDEATAG
jgi:uncharacterized hydrophobic protein (TIGR00271 family)